MKILINNPAGMQEVIECFGYFDNSRVIWSEDVDGPLPAITLGGMTRVEGVLVLDNTLLAAHLAARHTEKAKSVRATRDTLIAATDWTQLPDVPQTTKDKWVTHRKALRDVPQQAGFPFNVIWPT